MTDFALGTQWGLNAMRTFRDTLWLAGAGIFVEGQPSSSVARRFPERSLQAQGPGHVPAGGRR